MSAGGTLIGRVLEAAPAEPLKRWLLQQSQLDRLGALFLLLTALSVTAYGVIRPDYRNWDMVAYVATALENRYDDPQQLHAETWAIIEPEISEWQEHHLKYSNPYNLHQWENPADFQSQLSMYRVKVAFIAFVRLLEPLVGTLSAITVLSALSSLGIGLLCLWWLWRADTLQSSVFLVPLLLISDYSRMTAAAYPDVAASFVSLLAIYMLWRGRDWAASALLFTSVLFRPDNIVLVFALLITAFLFNWRKLTFIVTFLAALATDLMIFRALDHPGWWAHFYFSCVEMQNSMVGFDPDFSLAAMMKGYVRGFMGSLQSNNWSAVLAGLVAGWAALARHGRMTAPRANALAFALMIGALGKFASFPLPDDRFYFIFTTGLALVLTASWKPRFDRAATA